MFRFWKLVILLFVSISLSGLTAEVSAANKLRSAFLGPSVWEEGLSSRQINLELREHFSEVITRLESKNTSSLLTALLRAEATSTKEWTNSDRQAALIYLAHNRQKQIDRLRGYMHRGLFPVNEGQARKAVPIFVDQRKTHCAVGYLMHVDGHNDKVTEVVEANNLVKVMDANITGLANWIRSSGLTQEEAAMIQPSYAFNLDASFEDLVITTPTVERNGLTISSVTIRGSSFNASLPANFETDSTAIDDILAQGKAALETNNVVGTEIRSDLGIRFGFQPDDGFSTFGGFRSAPENLNHWLYIGVNDAQNGRIIQGPNLNGNVTIVEIEYELSSNRGNFSQIALTSTGANLTQGETSALLISSDVFDGDTSDLLGQVSLCTTGTQQLTSFVGSDTVSLDSESVRITTYGISVSGTPLTQALLESFFHEFETATLVGDFDGNGDVAVDDLDRYNQNIGAEATGDLAELDLDGDGVVGVNDFETHYQDLVMTSNGQVGTAQGDANLDGMVDVLEDAFTLVDNLGSTSITSWSQGDFNGNGVVDVLGDAFALVANLGFSNAP